MKTEKVSQWKNTVREKSAILWPYQDVVAFLCIRLHDSFMAQQFKKFYPVFTSVQRITEVLCQALIMGIKGVLRSHKEMSGNFTVFGFVFYISNCLYCYS